MVVVTTSCTRIEFITKIVPDKFRRKWVCGTRFSIVVEAVKSVGFQKTDKTSLTVWTWTHITAPSIDRTTPRDSGELAMVA